MLDGDAPDTPDKEATLVESMYLSILESEQWIRAIAF